MVPGRVGWFALFALAGYAQAAGEYVVSAHYTKAEFRIPMRDGKRLFTAVYTPKDKLQNYPILLERTPYGVGPYGKGEYAEHIGPSLKFEQDGYIFVYQDVRGRYMSEGDWLEMTPAKDGHGIDESTDTYDTIEWLLKNIPHNNGKVGLIGISYPGFYVSAGMINAHPALAAASPQAPVSDLYMGDDAFHNGAFFLLANFSFYVNFPKQHNPQLPDSAPPFQYGANDGYRFYLRMGALSNSDKRFFHYQNPYWTDILNHPNYDSFWKARDILPHLRDIKPAVLVVGGWYDAEDLSGALKTWRALRAQSPQTRATLVMGPWSHGEWSHGPASSLGEIRFGSDTGTFFRDEIELPFFRHYLKGAADPKLPAAYVFETGKNEWERKGEWPASGTTKRRLYLQGSGKLDFQKPAEEGAFDQYVSDPEHPVPFFPSPTLHMNREYMDGDQRFVRKRSDVLRYQTEPLSEDFTIAGPVSPSLFVSTSRTDSDFVVKLIDVYPDGYEGLIRGEPFRGKFRHSFEHPEPFRKNAVEPIAFGMPDVYHCFRKGHRVMVEVQSSWFPLVDRNPQTFTDIPHAKKSDFRKATERVYRSTEVPSSIEVMVEDGAG